MQSDQCPLQKCSLHATELVNTVLPVFPETTETQADDTGVPITFVSDSIIPLSILAPTPSSATYLNQVEEYGSDSDESVGVDEAEELVIPERAMTRSGRQVKTWARFDV